MRGEPAPDRQAKAVSALTSVSTSCRKYDILLGCPYTLQLNLARPGPRLRNSAATVSTLHELAGRTNLRSDPFPLRCQLGEKYDVN
jgi:hypothetical protein